MEKPPLNIEESLDDLDIKKAILYSTEEHQAFEKAKQLHEKYNRPETLAIKEEAAGLAFKTPQFKAFSEAIDRHNQLLANRNNKLPSVEIFTESDLQKADALLLEIDKLCPIIAQYHRQKKANITKSLEAQRLLMITQRNENVIEEYRKVAITSQFQQYKEAKAYYLQYPTADSQCMADTCAEELHKTKEYLIWLYKAKEKIKAYQPIHIINKTKDKIKTYQPIHKVYNIQKTKTEEFFNNLLLRYNAIENSPEYIQYKNAKIDYALAQLKDETTISFHEKELKTYKSNVKATQQFQEWEKALQQIEHVQVPEENFNKMVTAQKELYNTNTFKNYMDAYATYEANKMDHAGMRLLQNTYIAVTKTKQYQDLLVTQKEASCLVNKIKRCTSYTPPAHPIIGINYNPKESEKRFIVASMS